MHYHVDDRFLVEKGRVNYWGYNTLGFFAPDPRYATDRSPEGTSAGIQDDGPLAARRGNRGDPRRRLQPHRRGQPARADALVPRHRQRQLLPPGAQTRATTWTSPAAATRSTCSIRRCCSSSWTACATGSLEMHVDGFRFDLASTLARELYEVDRLGAFFDIIHQDPILSQVKLIAEPWDVGPGGYQVGNFPVLWTEWNGKYRDCVRRFWKGDGGTVSEFATRLAGSSDLYEQTGRRPYASINFITCHDGFTLAGPGLLQRQAQRGQRRRESRRRERQRQLELRRRRTDRRPGVLELRERQKRNFLATLMLSQGVPMLLAGDEIGHTQQGNNNAYCQDNELTWLNWDLNDRQQRFLDFTRKVSRIWREHPVFQRRKFFQGRALRGTDIKDISFLGPCGEEMSDEDWNAGLRQVPGRAAGRRPHRRHGRARRADRRRDGPDPAQRPS